MLAPLRSPRAPRRQVSKIANFPAPVGGWVSDAVAGMGEAVTARILTNIVPRQNSVYVRNGSKTVAEPGGRVDSLMTFDDGTIQDLLGASSGKLWQFPVDESATLVTPAELADGFSNDYWLSVMMANAADQSKLVMVNGEDGIWTYDGTDVEEAAASATNLQVSNVTSFKGRLWFTKRASASLWYGEVLSNSPATLTEFPVGAYLRRGGDLIAVDSLSMDGGSGPDDYLVAVSSRGELLVFSGIDPATDFQLVGLFSVGNPMSKRCLRKMGSDLLYYGNSGPQLLSKLFSTVEGLESLPIPIRTEFETAIYDYAFLAGWEMLSYSRAGWVMFNVPRGVQGTVDQYAVNLESTAWFRVEGWNAISWGVHAQNPYFGTLDGRVVRADFGRNDDGAPIAFDFMQTWNQFETTSRKKFNMAQVTIRANSIPKIEVDMNVDFKNVLPKSQPGFAPAVEVTPWDVSPWNISPWSGTAIYYLSSFGLQNNGYVGALRYRGQVKDSTHELMGFRIAFEEGAFL